MPTRFIILTMLVLSVLAGTGVDRIAARLSKRFATMATVVIAALLLGEYWAYPFAGVPFSINPPAIDRWLDTQPKPFVIAEVPGPQSGKSRRVGATPDAVDVPCNSALAEDHPRI
jgi:hypothetical protein